MLHNFSLILVKSKNLKTLGYFFSYFFKPNQNLIYWIIHLWAKYYYFIFNVLKHLEIHYEAPWIAFKFFQPPWQTPQIKLLNQLHLMSTLKLKTKLFLSFLGFVHNLFFLNFLAHLEVILFDIIIHFLKF